MLPNIWANGLSSASSQITGSPQGVLDRLNSENQCRAEDVGGSRKDRFDRQHHHRRIAAQFGERIASNVDLYRKIFALTASKPKDWPLPTVCTVGGRFQCCVKIRSLVGMLKSLKSVPISRGRFVICATMAAFLNTMRSH